LNALIDWLDKEFGLIHLTKPSAYHLYGQLLEGTIIDANIFPPSVLALINPQIERVLPDPEKIFRGALIATRRLISKLVKNEFILVPRFMEQMRNLYLLPLLGLTTYPFQIDRLEESQKSLFLKTYAPPLQEQASEAVGAGVQLLQQILANLETASWKENIHNDLEELSCEFFAKS